MRYLLLRRNANSNANGVAEGRFSRVGESVSPDLKLSADWVQGNALPLGEWVQGNALAAVNCCTPFRSCDN